MTVTSVVGVEADDGAVLSRADVEDTVATGLAGRLTGQDVLVVIPDHTRSLPLPLVLAVVADVLSDARRLRVVVALGTHPPLDPDHLADLVGQNGDDPGLPAGTEVLNHAWQDDEALAEVGTLSEERLRTIAGDRWHDSLAGGVPVRLNRLVTEADHVVIVGPTFPHEVVGFSGGYKYLFPGLSGPEMIDRSHWLGALCGVEATIGIADTPVRAMVHAAAELVDTPATLVALVVEGSDDLAAVFVGDPVDAWRAAADASEGRHVRYVDHPYEQVLSWAPPMYDELWTAAKAAYKLEQVVAPGGELVIYAPHLDEVSAVHGRAIAEVGYHTLPWILDRWDEVGTLPLAVLAHSTHVRGPGELVDGRERPHHGVTLASRIPERTCAELGLGYLDPDSIDPEAWRGRDDAGVLLVERAGEMLYRLR